MIWLIFGVLLWSAAHWFRRVAPGVRERMGDKGKGLVALLVVASIVLMVIGYRAADPTPLWYLGDWAIHANNLLMLLAMALFGVGHSKSRLRGMMRHPMLNGMVVWAVAHLMVNGDLPSLVLWGGLAGWALLTMMVVNASDPAPEPYSDGTLKGDIRLFVLTLVFFGVATGIHAWIGPWPFPG